ncbi:MAG: hypothetical protein KBD37_07095, partial [Burkholderiales bacterium]|nr:hypothetical protein [Burkholderiales bacterium]
INSAPSVSNKVSQQILIKEKIEKLATSAWNCVYNIKKPEVFNSEKKEAKVHRVGSFGVNKYELEKDSVDRARAYIEEEIIKDDDTGKDSWILDSRILDGNHEKKVFERHLKILTIAVHQINKDRENKNIKGRVKFIGTHIPTTKKGFRVGASVYDPIHPLGHKNLTPFKSRTYSFDSSDYDAQLDVNKESNPAAINNIIIEIKDRASMLVELKELLKQEICDNVQLSNGQEKYMLLCLVDKAIELLSKPNLNFGEGLLYDTLLTILAKYIPNNYHVLLGCVSAKDRTTMEVALMNALMPLIEDIISGEDSKELNQFFNNITPYNQINVKFLTPEQIAKFIDNYDDKDNLYFSNRMNTGITTNINPFEMLGWVKPLLYHPKFAIYGKDHPGA